MNILFFVPLGALRVDNEEAKRNFDCNHGCAEGYYAVGFAFKKFAKMIYAVIKKEMFLKDN
jgi:hypothetical protein